MNKQKDKELSYEELLKKSDEYLNGWKRALADYHNLERETAKKKGEWLQLANEGLLFEFLPVYDNLKLALKHSKAEKEDWLAGIEHVAAQFKKVLEENGVMEIKTVGEEFDPAVHEAVAAQETVGSDQKNKPIEQPKAGRQDIQDKQDNIIKKEVKAGYKLNGKVIYPAQVIV